MAAVLLSTALCSFLRPGHRALATEWVRSGSDLDDAVLEQLCYLFVAVADGRQDLVGVSAKSRRRQVLTGFVALALDRARDCPIVLAGAVAYVDDHLAM